MNERDFKSYLNRARIIGGDYAAGYQRGLRRHHYGEKYAEPGQHDIWLRLGLDGDPRTEEGAGYRDGFAGKPPEGLGPGRPMMEEEPQERRNISISASHMEKAKRIGGGKMSEGIRSALDAYDESAEKGIKWIRQRKSVTAGVDNGIEIVRLEMKKSYS